jgi:peptidoglycan/LPS O-acetylase OafA/YrhL
VFPCFDGLRAIAAFLVIVVHAAFQAGITTGTSWGPYTARGEIGVAVFFLISGFLLYRPFAAAHLSGRDGPDAGGFLIRRFLRIVPLYWVALWAALAVVSDERLDVHGFGGLLQCMFFLQGYRADWVIQGLTQAWTLDVEVAFYIFLPVYAWLLGRGRRAAATGASRRSGPPRPLRRRSPDEQLRAELVGVAVLFLAGKLVHRVVIPFDSGVLDGWSSWLPVWWDLFSIGMALAAASAWYARLGRSPRWARLPGSGTACWLLAAACYWVASTRIDLPLTPIFDASITQDMARHLFYSLFGLFLILPAVFGRADRGWVRPLLASRPMAFLGLISYGLYLWHGTVIDLVMHYSGWQVWRAPHVPFLLLVFGITVAVSSVTYALIERPCIALGRSWATRLRGRRPPRAGGVPAQPAAHAAAAAPASAQASVPVPAPVPAAEQAVPVR